MAKKKKNRAPGDKSEAPPTTSAAGPSAATTSGAPGAPASIERAFQVGNFAEVRRLAAGNGGPESDRTLALVKIDRAQLLVGLAALVFLVVVALVVLRL